MILQVSTNGRKGMPKRHTSRCEHRRRADARELQHLRRPKRTRGQEYLWGSGGGVVVSTCMHEGESALLVEGGQEYLSARREHYR